MNSLILSGLQYEDLECQPVSRNVLPVSVG